MKKQKRLYQFSLYLFIFLNIALYTNKAWAQERLLPQKYLVLDKYSLKRIYISEGDVIRFSLKGDKAIFNDRIGELNEVDSTIFLEGAKIVIPIKEFSTFYFPRPWTNASRAGLGLIGGGFLISAAVYPLMGNNVNYEPKEQFVIGTTALVLGQLTRFFKVKTFRINRNSRIRVMNMK